MVWSPAFSRAFVSLSVFTMSFPWLMLMLSFFMIIQFFDSRLQGPLYEQHICVREVSMPKSY